MARLIRRSALLLTFLALAALPSRARADEPPDERRALVEAAWQAHTEGDHARAIALAEKAIALRRSSALHRFLGEQRALLGHAREAYVHAVTCARLAENEAPSPNREQVLDACRALAREERARIGMVKLVIASPAPAGLRVTVGGAEPAEGEVPIEPGAVTVDATAPGYRHFASHVNVLAGSEVELRVALEPESPAPPIRPPAAEGARRSRSLAPPVMLGAATAAFAGALVLRLVANGKYDDLRATCQGAGGCPDGAAERSAIRQMDAIAIGAAVAGGALAAAGLTLFLIDERAPTHRAAWLGLGPGAVRVGGTF